MNNIQLEKILSFIANKKAKVFVLAKNEMYNNDMKDSLPTIFCINTINLESAHLIGHWVLVFVFTKRGKRVSYTFDSYGQPLSFYGIKNPYPVINENRKKLQCFNSKVCGEYVVYVCNKLLNGIPFYKIINSFSQNCEENDNKVEKYVSRLHCHYSCNRAYKKTKRFFSCCEMKTVLKYCKKCTLET